MSKKTTTKKSPKTKKITVALYDNHEMGFILIDDEVVFSGNYWDFHSGCQGTKIGGFEVGEIWDSGTKSLAGALKTKIEETGAKAEIVQKNLTDAEYKAMGY